jgi:hydrogenase maturation protease
MNVLILGLGNWLLRDEGIGVHAVHTLARRYALPEGVDVLDGGTSGLGLLDAVAGRDHLIVCDAIQSDERPGSVVRIDGDAVPAFFAQHVSPHQLGLCDLLANLELIGEKPAHIAIVGIVPADLRLGIELSAAGRAGMEAGIDCIVSELAALGLPLEGGVRAAAGAG